MLFRSFPSHDTIVSDKGGEFTSQLSEDLFRLMQIDHRTTTAYHPQCNSQAEVANKTIAKYLASFVDSSTLEWEDLLAPLMFSYNTSYHRSVKNTPFYLTFGIEPRSPYFDPQGIRQKFYGESSTDDLYNRLQTAREVARLNNEDATQSAQRQYDAKAEPHNYQIGQLVLLSENYFINKNVKLAPKWTGPHRIISLKGPCNAELKLANNRKLIVHVNRLKPYHQQQKHEAVFPDNQARAELSETDIVPTQSNQKRTKQSSVRSAPKKIEKEAEFDEFPIFSVPRPATRVPQPVPQPQPQPQVQTQPTQPVSHIPTQPKPRGRPRKSYSEAVTNPSPISRQASHASQSGHSTTRTHPPPPSDLISSRTRSKGPAFSLNDGGSEGLVLQDSTPAFIDADTAAFAASAIPTTTTANINDNEEWVLVVRKHRKKKHPSHLQE